MIIWCTNREFTNFIFHLPSPHHLISRMASPTKKLPTHCQIRNAITSMTTLSATVERSRHALIAYVSASNGPKALQETNFLTNTVQEHLITLKGSLELTLGQARSIDNEKKALQEKCIILESKNKHMQAQLIQLEMSSKDDDLIFGQALDEVEAMDCEKEAVNGAVEKAE